MRCSTFSFVGSQFIPLTLSCGGRYHIETSPLICSANQWTSFYMIWASVMKELNSLPPIWCLELRKISQENICVRVSFLISLQPSARTSPVTASGVCKSLSNIIMMELFCEDSFELLTIFTKNFIVDIWQDLKYASEILLILQAPTPQNGQTQSNKFKLIWA